MDNFDHWSYITPGIHSVKRNLPYQYNPATCVKTDASCTELAIGKTEHNQEIPGVGV
jgi:hypothetical protein